MSTETADFCLAAPCTTTSASRAGCANTGVYVYIQFHYVQFLTSTPALRNFKKIPMY